MRRALAAALLALSALLTCCGKQVEQPDPSPALWEVSGPEGRHGYLFGTIHALPDGIEWRTAVLERTFADAEALVVEVDLPRAAPHMQEIFGRLAETPGLPPLSVRAEPALRPDLKQAMAQKGLTDADFAGVETWAAALTLAQAYQVGTSANGVDLALLQSARGKQVVELEGLEPQLRLFDALPEDEQRDLLEGVVTEIEDGDYEAAAQSSIRAWLTGDVAALEKDSQRGLLADPELRRELLVARNRDWAAQVDALLRGGDRPFVAVGAAHLVGPNGLAALLSARGYRVRRIQ